MHPLPAGAETPADHVLLVGRDADGRWIVQENHGLIEGLFVSRQAAMHFAMCERHAFPAARIELVTAPLRSILSRWAMDADDADPARRRPVPAGPGHAGPDLPAGPPPAPAAGKRPHKRIPGSLSLKRFWEAVDGKPS